MRRSLYVYNMDEVFSIPVTAWSSWSEEDTESLVFAITDSKHPPMVVDACFSYICYYQLLSATIYYFLLLSLLTSGIYYYTCIPLVSVIAAIFFLRLVILPILDLKHGMLDSKPEVRSYLCRHYLKTCR